MDGAAFQGMPRIALTPAEEAQIPRPHSSASQVATAIPSAYSRTTSPPPSLSNSPRHPHHRNHHNSITYHPYYTNNFSASGSLARLGAHLGSPSSASIPNSDTHYSRPSSPAPRPSTPSQHHITSTPSPSISSHLNNNTTSTTGEQEYPQNPQELYYSHIPPRTASPGPSRLAFALGSRPARSPSPQLYGNSLYDHYQPRSSYFHRNSYDVHPRPGSPLQQEHQDSWDSVHGSRQRVDSPNSLTDSDEDSGSECESGHPRRTSQHHHRPISPQRSNSKSILSRLRETTSRLSLGDEYRRSSRASQESHRDNTGPQATRNSQDSSTSPPVENGGKEILQDLSDEERGLEPRKSRSGWRPSLSLIRQESSIGSTGNNNLYMQNNPHRISDMLPHGDPLYDSSNVPPRKSSRKKNSKASKKKRRRQKKRRAEKLAALQKQQQLYDQQMAEQALYLPELTQVLDKKTRYPLSYDDFEAFLRSQRAVEYLNFWTDVTAHERLCRTFDVSERRHKRELQLEERAIARDKRRVAMLAAMESGRITPDPDLLTPGFGAGTGIGISASGQDIEGSNHYSTSRSSLQLPLNEHLSFPPESRRYGIQDSSAPFPSHPSSHLGYFQSSITGDSQTRQLVGAGAERSSNEFIRQSLEEAHISEQDAAVAAVALRAQRSGLITPLNQSGEDVRRGSFDYYRPLPGGISSNSPLPSLRYHQNNNSNGFIGGQLPNSYSVPNAYNLLMRGRGSVDMIARSNSRNSRVRPSVTEDYFGNGIRRVTSQNFQSPQTPPQLHNTQNQQDESGAKSSMTQTEQEIIQDEHAGNHTQDIPELRRQASQYSITFTEPELHRRPSTARFGGYGTLQASAMGRRSGESAYAPSLYSMGQEGRALLVQSFRTIGLEDVQESALRIYRKYLIQLRTASMAAEEEAAAFSASKEANGNQNDRLNRHSLEKTFAPGWDGYAEEVIAQWNEKWKGRSREARRSRRLANRRGTSFGKSADADYSGQPSTVGDEDGSADQTKETDQRIGLSINTQAKPLTPDRDHRRGDESNQSNRDDNNFEEEDYDNEDEDDDFDEGASDRRGNSSVPSSPLSPRMKKRAGTGLSAFLNPFLTRLMRTETTVVELPTLTINTTTVEEEAVMDDFDEIDDSDEDDEEDEDSDDEDEGDEDDEAGNESDQNTDPLEKATNAQSQTKRLPDVQIISKNTTSTLPTLEREKDVEEVIIEEVHHRSIATVASSPSIASTSSPSQGYVSDTEALDNAQVAGVTNPSEHPTIDEFSRKNSISSSLSSSWDQITRKDLEKQVTILPPPATTSSNRSMSYRLQGLRGVRQGTKKAARSASRTAHNVSLQLLTFWKKPRHQNTDSSSSSLDVMQITPATSPRMDVQFQIPAIVMDSPSSNEKDRASEMLEGNDGNSQESAISAKSPIMPLQNTLVTGNQLSATNMSVPGMEQKSVLQSPLRLPGSPGLSVTSSKLSTAPTSPQLSIDQVSPGVQTPQFSGSSPAAVAASAAAAAFYLPLECRQRIHTQVQEEGRTEAPHLYGPAKGFVTDVVLQDHYYPLFLEYVEQQNLGLLTKNHPNNLLKYRGTIWSGVAFWLVVITIQLTLIFIGRGGWGSPWVWLTGIIGGWMGSICLATGMKRFSPFLGIAGKMCEDKHLFRFRVILEPSIRIRHRLRAYWMLIYCFFWSTIIAVIFAALPQRAIS